MTDILSTPSRTARSSAIRDLLRHADRDDVISLAGGIPNAGLFPAAELADAAARRLGAGEGLQYGLTEGETELREWIVGHHALAGDEITLDQVLVTTGSQQALDLVGRVLLDPGDEVVVGDPVYVGALQALRFQQPAFGHRAGRRSRSRRRRPRRPARFSRSSAGSSWRRWPTVSDS